MHTIFTESIPILTSNLFMTRDALTQHLLLMNSFVNLPTELKIPTYQDRVVKSLQSFPTQLQLTTNYSDSTLDKAIAYHAITGTIYYDSYYWYFSSKRFMQDILEAENNPGIISHLIVVSSGGGESYCIDTAMQVLARCKKPVVVMVEGVMASAALYLTLPATKIYTQTNFDIIGSIGTMIAFWDVTSYWKELGLKFIEAYATESTHKNKKVKDLIDDTPTGKEEYVKTVLDPLQEAFHKAVATYRPDTLKAPVEAHVFNGETWYASDAYAYGLIDGYNKTFQECATEAYELGIQHQSEISTQQKIYSLIN
ncbi:MAG: hypothetical protein EGP82_01960 [Odoribacter splanchnicus]|nr:hypothetical protein [Odoribacter splanchnicus]